MTGVKGDPTYGYSIFAFEARDGVAGTDLARGHLATASSADTGHDPALATDGDVVTRWAVSRADRTRGDSWLAVDLGAPTALDRARLYWEAAAGQAYRIETSVDGIQWTVAATYPRDDLHSTGKWLNVDGRAGFVVHGSVNPIAVRGDTVVLSDGPASSAVIEGYVGARDLRPIAAAGTPTSTVTIHASTADAYLSLFNLTGQPASGTVSIGQSAIRLYRGTQRVTATGTDYDTTMAPATALVEPWRFTLRNLRGGPVPAGISATVVDAQHITLAGPPSMLGVTQTGTGLEIPVVLPAMSGRTVTFPAGRPYPLADLAAGRVTFPTSPLPPGMSDPFAAVDDDPRTSWTPGRNGRMAVDLGGSQPISGVSLQWTTGVNPSVTVSTSVDGVTYIPGTAASSARYVAVSTGWRSGQATLVSVVVHP